MIEILIAIAIKEITKFAKNIFGALVKLILGNKRLIFEVLLIIVVIGLLLTFTHQKQHLNRVSSNLNQRVETYKDKLEKTVSQKKQLTVTFNELKRAHKKNILLRTGYENKLAETYSQIRNLKKKIKHVDNITTIETIKTDTIKIKLIEKDTIRRIGTFADKYGSYNFEYNSLTDTLQLIEINYNKLYVVLSRRHILNRNNKKYLFLIRWLKPWEYLVTVKSDNDILVNFESVKCVK